MKKIIIIVILFLLLLITGGNTIFKHTQLSLMEKKVDNTLVEKNLSDKIIKEKDIMSGKTDVYTKEIVFNDEKDILYKVRIYSYPDLLQTLKLKSYSPEITCNGYKNNEVLEKAKYNFTKK